MSLGVKSCNMFSNITLADKLASLSSEEQIKELIRINSEWQRYDSQREEYIQKLLNRIKDLDEKNFRLNNDIGLTMAEMVKVTDTSTKNKDIVELLRAQINVCVEDFKKERQDRERVNAENVKFKDYIYHLGCEPEDALKYKAGATLGASTRRQPFKVYNVSNGFVAGKIGGYRYYEYTDLPRDVEIDGLDPETHREYNPNGGFDEPDPAIENV